jgi:hypothetical protein
MFQFLVNLLPLLTPRPKDNDISPRDLPTGLELLIIEQLNATVYCGQEWGTVAGVAKSSLSRGKIVSRYMRALRRRNGFSVLVEQWFNSINYMQLLQAGFITYELSKTRHAMLCASGM